MCYRSIDIENKMRTAWKSQWLLASIQLYAVRTAMGMDYLIDIARAGVHGTEGVEGLGRG